MRAVQSILPYKLDMRVTGWGLRQWEGIHTTLLHCLLLWPRRSIQLQAGSQGQQPAQSAGHQSEAEMTHAAS